MHAGCFSLISLYIKYVYVSFSLSLSLSLSLSIYIYTYYVHILLYYTHTYTNNVYIRQRTLKAILRELTTELYGPLRLGCITARGVKCTLHGPLEHNAVLVAT
jgi:hypothetical protein